MKNKKQAIFLGMIALLLVQIPALQADTETKVKREFQLTTYYPAPYGDYKEINTTGDTRLATSSGNVVIGTKDTNPKAKLEVNNTLLLMPVKGDAVAQTGGDEGAIRYSKDANGKDVGGLLYRNANGWAPLAGGGGTGGTKVVKGTYAGGNTGNCYAQIDCGAGYHLIQIGIGEGGDAKYEAACAFAGSYQNVASVNTTWDCFGEQTCKTTTACKQWAIVGLCAPKAS